MLPAFFNTDMSADVEYVTHEEPDGLYVTATVYEDGEAIGSMVYGPLRKLSSDDAATFRLEAWGGSEPMSFQDGEAFEDEHKSGALVIFVRWGESYYMAAAVDG